MQKKQVQNTILLVLEKYDKCFKLQLDIKIDTVSIDRLKSAYIPTNNHSKNETFIDLNQSTKNNPQGNKKENENAVCKDQNNIQNNNVAHDKTKKNR